MKRVKLLLLITIVMILSISLTGCGGDKFAGKWIMQDGAFNNPHEEIGYMDIEKNGESYIVIINKEYIDKSNYFSAKITGNKDAEIEVSWKKDKRGPYPARVMGNTIACDLGDFWSTINIMHIEKDNSLMLQINGTGGIMLTKYRDKDNEAVKSDKQIEFLLKFAKDRPEVNMKFKHEQKK
ncbi:MAG: hypothetical protein Q4E68_13195 [Prevotellaceae bacterium]|nr:hypothetical protein [Prevotellaceae bacterium]